MKPRGIDPGDIDAVRSALHHVRDSDELLGLEGLDDADEARAVRRLLVDELVDFLERRDEIIDSQVSVEVDMDRLLGPESW